MALAVFGVVSCLSPGVSTAQDQPAAAVEPAAAGDAGPVQRVNGKVLFNFQDAPLQAVIEHLAEVTGLVIIKPAAVDSRVTLVTREPLTISETIQVLNSALQVNGLAAVRTGRTLKILPASEASTADAPVEIGSNPLTIPETDEIITQVVPVRNVQAVQLVRDMQPLVSPTAAIVANADSNTVIITDRAVSIRRLVQIIAAMDRSQSDAVEVRVFPLQYARAGDAARLIEELFTDQSAGRNDQGSREDRMRAFFRRRGGEEGGNNGSEAAGLRTPTVTASSDDRTNTLVVSASPDMLKIIEGVVQELDSNPTATQGVFIYALRNAQAENLESILSNLFGTNSATQATTGGAANRGGANNRNTANTVRSNARNTTANTNNRGGNQNRGAQLTAQSLEQAGDLYGQVSLVADVETNSLLVMTAPGYFDAVRGIIADLDTPVPQVLIKVLVAEVTHSDGLDLGVEFSVLNVPDASSLMTDFGVASANGGVIYKLLKTDLEMTIRALEENGKLEVLSRPYILTADNQLATITVGSEVPFVTSTQFTELGGTTSTVRYEDVGIILNVTPSIGPDGKVTMDVSPEISALSGETVRVSEDVFLPVIEKRAASTRVAIEDGRTIVIGGLMEDRLTSDVDKVPILGDIPILGHFFKRERQNKRKTELLIFLTPHVATDPGELSQLTAGETRNTAIVPEAVAPGEYERHREALDRRGPGAQVDVEGRRTDEAGVTLEVDTGLRPGQRRQPATFSSPGVEEVTPQPNRPRLRR